MDVGVFLDDVALCQTATQLVSFHLSNKSSSELIELLPSMSTRSLSYPPESKRRSSFSSSTIFSSLVSSCLAASFLAAAAAAAAADDLPPDELGVDLSSLLPALLNLESGLLVAAVPEGGLPPRPGVGLVGPSFLLTGRERTGAGALT